MINEKSFPIIEFDDEKEIISSDLVTSKYEKLPDDIDTAVMLFERRTDLDIFKKCEKFYEYKGGSFLLPQYIYDHRIVIALVPLGAAAAAGLMEELISLGVKKFIACGSAGAISDIDTAKFVLVESAIRDEGTSYHYLPASPEVELDMSLIEAIEIEMKRMNLDYIKGKTWTTDAFYRETPKRIERRRNQGALCVEMECSALAAVAKFRKVQFAQILYFSDIVKQTSWSGFAQSSKEIKAKLNEITLEIALSIKH